MLLAPMTLEYFWLSLTTRPKNITADMVEKIVFATGKFAVLNVYTWREHALLPVT